jgi:hypothetical protein
MALRSALFLGDLKKAGKDSLATAVGHSQVVLFFALSIM